MLSPDTRPASRWPVAAGIASKRFSIPLWTNAEPLFESQHLLADDLEAEVSGLDDAGVNRPHGDLVHAVAFDPDERVFLLARLPFRRGDEIAAQRELIDRPARLPQPRTLIVRLGSDSDEIERGALHPVRRGEDDGEVRVRRFAGRQRVLEENEPVARPAARR